MSVRSCRVTIQDLDGTSHTAEVTASSLYEAVAQGLAALRKNEWVEGIEEERFGIVKVSVAEVRVEHQVKIVDFMKWLERPGRTPREITHRLRIREISRDVYIEVMSRLACMLFDRAGVLVLANPCKFGVPKMVGVSPVVLEEIEVGTPRFV